MVIIWGHGENIDSMHSQIEQGRDHRLRSGYLLDAAPTKEVENQNWCAIFSQGLIQSAGLLMLYWMVCVLVRPPPSVHSQWPSSNMHSMDLDRDGYAGMCG